VLLQDFEQVSFMDFNELEQLISKDETKNIELKKSTSELRDVSFPEIRTVHN